jgi:hypothetical protein
VDLPVPLGPKRKKLCAGILKNRGCNSILSLNLEVAIPRI